MEMQIKNRIADISIISKDGGYIRLRYHIDGIKTR